MRRPGGNMKLKKVTLTQIVSDLGLDKPFARGQVIKVRKCWHFSTDGNAVDQMFYDDNDFIAGMNRVYVVVKGYKVVILAFSLMDTHVHFILYGEIEECRRFMHDYVARTSRHIAITHGDNNKLADVPIHYQEIDTDSYLKTAICYTVKNAPAGGISYMGWDYPWSSGPLYFRRPSLWSSPSWTFEESHKVLDEGLVRQRQVLRTRNRQKDEVRMIGDIIFPGEYVAYEVVEMLFKTCRSFNFFMCISKEDDVDSRGGTISHLSIPMSEMRQHKNEVCRELFGVTSVKGLSTTQRVRLARTLRSRYNSSIKQIIRLSGLVYSEVKGRL